MANFHPKRSEDNERKKARPSSLDLVLYPDHYMQDFWAILKEFCDKPALEKLNWEWPGDTKPKRILRQFRAFQKSMRKYPQKGYERFYAPGDHMIPWHLHSRQIPAERSGTLLTEFKRVAYWADSPMDFESLFNTALRS